ncbi:DUF4251 domain-containing protein [Maribacter sp. 1_MG-2023]|uniref:DUF4251 domain-containing protein n=1 Tax=Maribacter sp. 1_MG-2023 TaxID=3062677 RepID=UPI0026E3A394|nr:DUF4251 domain-containing protein [Maribacter sp. 1_MG-2023]MDO6472146.1 DUF4251 domain-containing protein [Maribacter sp. 1_MG-2023]
MRTSLILIATFIVLLGCKSSKTAIDDTHPIHSLVASKNIEFIAKSASPTVTRGVNAAANRGLLPPGSNVSRIDLNGTSNYLKIFGDSVSANLPFYGERQFGGGYGSATGVEFNGVADNYKQDFNNDKQKYSISFQVSDKSDSYSILMEIFPNNSSSVSVNMSNRSRIQYNGTIKAIEEDK